MKKKIKKTSNKKISKRISKKVSKKTSSKRSSKRNPIEEQYTYTHPRNINHFIDSYTPGRNKGYDYPKLTGTINSLAEAKSILKPYQYSIRKNNYGEYEVYPIGSLTDRGKIFSNDLTDAVMTGITQSRLVVNDFLRRNQYDPFGK